MTCDGNVELPDRSFLRCDATGTMPMRKTVWFHEDVGGGESFREKLPTRHMINESSAQLRMIWPRDRQHAPPPVKPPSGYLLRTCRQGDEARFYELMALAGWPGWDAETLQPWLERMLPEGWFLAIHQGSNQIVATAMALRDCSEFGGPGGELGWVASDPAHRGQGLGLLVSAAVTSRLLAEGYQHIHLYTEPWRLAALKTYLKLGYVPLITTQEAWQTWRTICGQLEWPFTPEVWV